MTSFPEHRSAPINVFALGVATSVTLVVLFALCWIVALALAETTPGLMLASTQLAQTEVYYYGYWVYDADYDYYYWFTADVVIVGASWVDYVL